MTVTLTMLTLAASLSEALAMDWINGRAGFSPKSLGILGLWAVAPYHGHAIAALSARRHRDTSSAILFGTIASASLVDFVFAFDLQPWVDARS